MVTHSLHLLEPTDMVVALSEGPGAAYVGEVKSFPGAFGASSNAAAMDALVEGAKSSQRQIVTLPASRAPVVGRGPRPSPRLPLAHLKILAQRELARALHHWVGLLLAALGFVVATVMLTAIAGPDGLSIGADLREPRTTVLILTTCVAFFSLAFSFSSVVDDLDVIKREARWGITPSAFILARFLGALPVAVFVAVAATLAYLQSMPGPDDPVLPVYAAALTISTTLSAASVALGLLISAVASRLKATVLVLMSILAAEVMLSGLTFSLTRDGFGVDALNTASWLMPTRWAVAAWAAQLGFEPDGDPLWTSDVGHIVTAVAVLLALAATFLVIATAFLRVRLRARS
jgi:hypothetical protein